MSDKTILIVEDDLRMREMIKMILTNRNYKTIEAENGEEGVTLTKVMEPDLILMDVMMPVMDGLVASERIRDFSECPIIMLTAKGEEYDQLNGFESGVDDYVVKPFTPMVLVARIEAVLRRSKKGAEKKKQEDKLVLGQLTIDLAGRVVLIGGNAIELSKKEFDLLLYLGQNYDITLSREQILEKVWGYDYLGSESTVDTHMNRLRKKLLSCSDYVKTIRGFGYKFEVTYND